jgi:methylated-DNA-[protein]-cysteine S-methyltransferase
MHTPVGELTLVSSPHGLHAISWDIDKRGFDRSDNEKTIRAAKKQLTEYFLGKRKVFDLPLVLEGTDFQIEVWNQLLKIPYGETISYAQQAERIGNKNKARAVGVANGRNHIAIVIPCHRVIGSNGHLVGFGGGMRNKAFLLQLERDSLE